MSDFIDWHISYNTGNIKDMHYYISKTKKVKKKRCSRDQKQLKK